MNNRLRRYWPVLAVVLGVIAILLTWWLTPRPLHFESTDQLKELAEAQGLHVHTSTRSLGFFISEYPLEPRDLPIRKGSGDLGPEWQGIIWVQPLEKEDADRVLPPSASDQVRRWGKVLAYGDPNLLNRIEEIAQ